MVRGLYDTMVDRHVSRHSALDGGSSLTRFGLLPVLWSHGAGTDVMQRIAAPMIGGIYAYGGKERHYQQMRLKSITSWIAVKSLASHVTR